MLKKIVVHHLGEQRYVGLNENGNQLILDASGQEVTLGMRPMEALLSALATCSAYDVVEMMKARRTPLSRYRIEIEGVRAETNPKRYTHILLRHIASGEGVNLASLERSAQQSHEKYCSVAASLNSEISIEVVIE